MIVYSCPAGHISSVMRPNDGKPRCFFCGEPALKENAELRVHPDDCPYHDEHARMLTPCGDCGFFLPREVANEAMRFGGHQ